MNEGDFPHDKYNSLPYTAFYPIRGALSLLSEGQKGTFLVGKAASM